MCLFREPMAVPLAQVASLAGLGLGSEIFL